MRLKGAALLFLVALAGLAWHFLPAHAADGTYGITTSPLPILLSAAPGQTVATNLRVQNNTTQTESLKVGLLKFGASGIEGRPDLQVRGPNDTYFDWVSFSPSQFDAPPGQWTTVKMTINIPSSAAFGYYYAVTFSPASQASSSINQSHANVIGSTATLVLLNVNVPGEKSQISLKSFYSDRRLYQFLPASFSVIAHNSGNIYTSPGGTIFIKKGKKVVGTIDINRAGGNILPGTNRLYTEKWSDGFPVYQPVLVNGKPAPTKGAEKRSLHFDFSKFSHFRFGKYNAQLVLTYNDGVHDVPLVADLSFWVIPIVPLIILLVIVIVVLAGFFLVGRSGIRRAAKTVKPKNKK